MSKRKIILKDSIQGVTKNDIKRLCYRAAVKRIGGLVYEEIRNVITVYLEEIMKDAIVFMENSRYHTLREKDVAAALEIHGYYLGIGGFEYGHPGDSSPGSGGHRFKPGTVALRKIRKYQRTSSLLIRPLPFSRLVREIGQQHRDNLRIGDATFGCIQLVLETYIVKVLAQSNKVAIHNKRGTVDYKDIRLVRDICRDMC